LPNLDKLVREQVSVALGFRVITAGTEGGIVANRGLCFSRDPIGVGDAGD
jgi:hypothetical protein